MPPSASKLGGINYKTMNLSSIIVLLQTVLALLGNPQMAGNAQVQVLANQAIGMASQALSSPTTAVQTSTITIETPTSTSQPIVVNVQPYTPSEPQSNVTAPEVLKAVPQPSCTVSVDYLNSPVNVSWNVENATTFIPSMQWRYTNTDGTQSSWIPMVLAPTYVPPHDPSVQVTPETTQASIVTGLNLLNDQGSSRLGGMIGQTQHYPLDVQLSMGGATCDYTITK
jgi:hypothetical protein